MPDHFKALILDQKGEEFTREVKSIDKSLQFLYFSITNCDQLPGAAPKSMTEIPFLRILCLLLISCNLYTARDLKPSLLDFLT